MQITSMLSMPLKVKVFVQSLEPADCLLHTQYVN